MDWQFLDPPNEQRAAAYTILPVPYDSTSTWIKGADRGPEALIKASRHVELYDMETGGEAWKRGIRTLWTEWDFSSPETMAENVRLQTAGLLEAGTFPIILGGEHSVSIGSVRAEVEIFKNLSVLQLDAHADLREKYEGSIYNHACVMARVRELCPIVQVGIRSMDAEEENKSNPARLFPAHEIYDSADWMDKAVSLLTENVYITIDLDVFDPSIMPSTGTPEPGGLDWYLVVNFLKKVFQNRNVTGFDVVELCPGSLHGPDYLAAKLVYKLINYHDFYKNKI